MQAYLEYILLNKSILNDVSMVYIFLLESLSINLNLPSYLDSTSTT